MKNIIIKTILGVAALYVAVYYIVVLYGLYIANHSAHII